MSQTKPITVTEAIDGTGIVVELLFEGEDDPVTRFVAYAGGEWMINRDGTTGRQIVGTSDISAPRDLARATAWANRHYATLVNG